MNLNLHFADINWLSVIVVTILTFPLGALWHSKSLFGKVWTEDARPSFDPGNKAVYIRLFALSALFHFIALTGLDLVIGKDSTALNGMVTGFLVSFAWVFTTLAVTHMFANRRFRLILIDAGFYLVMFSIAGLVLGAW